MAQLSGAEYAGNSSVVAGNRDDELFFRFLRKCLTTQRSEVFACFSRQLSEN